LEDFFCIRIDTLAWENKLSSHHQKENLIRITIGNIDIDVISPNPNIIFWVEKRYEGHHSQESECFQVMINVSEKLNDPIDELPQHPILDIHDYGINLRYINGYGEINILTHKGFLNVSHSFQIEIEYYFRVLISLIAFKTNGLLIHSAGVVHNEKGYVFTGHSGSGKTTITYLSKDKIVLNDDLLLIIPGNEDWLVYATPFSKDKSRSIFPSPIKISGIFFLQQDYHVYIEEINLGEALAEFVANVPVINSSPKFSVQLLERSHNLLNTLPFYRLHFRKDDSFWSIIDSEVNS